MSTAATQLSLDRLLSNLPGMAYRCLNDRCWTMVFVSDGAHALTGFQAQDLTDSKTLRFVDLIHPDDLAFVQRQVDAALHTGHVFQVTYRIRTANGSQKWMWEQGSTVLDQAGQPIALEGFITDITAIKQAEQEASRAAAAQLQIVEAQKEIASASLSMPAVLDLIAQRAQQLTGATGAAVQFIDNNDMVYAAASGAAANQVGLRFPRDGSLSGLAMACATVLSCDDTETDDRVDRAICRKVGVRSMIVAPLHSGEQLIGALVVHSGQVRAFTGSDSANLQILAESLGTVIQRNRAAEQVRASEKQYRFLFENNPHPMWVYEIASLRILAVNQAAIAHYGYAEEAFLALTIRELRPTEDIEELESVVKNLTPERSSTRVWRHRKKDGALIQVEVSSDAIDFNGKSARLVLANDVTERLRAERDLARVSRENLHLALYDPLTKLPNRLLLTERLQHALATNARNQSQGALLFIDLDNFKNLNDTFGHNVGDLLLQEVARRISKCIRDSDTVARLGGDEFVVILESLSADIDDAAEQAKTVAEKVLGILNQPYLLANYEHYTAASIGIALFHGAATNVNTLLKQADLSMYQAKASGRNTLRFFDPAMQAAASARSALEADLRRALQEHEFVLHYQTQVDQTGSITGAEALVRWLHPVRGMISPAEFIPLAEDTGLIVPLGQWVIEEACRQLAAWMAEPASAHLKVAVNVSARQFRHPSFVDHLFGVFDASGIDPRQLKLELTESLLIEDMQLTIEKMTHLKSRGVKFSLDDFGTGYSSLYYLKSLPLDQLKIDQSFVRDVLTDPNDAAIVRTIITLGASLGFAVIAEGVETEAQRDFLFLHGCRAFQGYLYSRPVPARELTTSVMGLFT